LQVNTYSMGKTINILFIGDIVGANGLAMVTKLTKGLVEKHKIDAVIANGENINDGKSLNKKHARELFDAGVSMITTGNHVWDRWEAKPLLWEERRILRPLNYPRENGGSGFGFFEAAGVKIGVINVQGRTFLPAIDCPFKACDWAIEKLHQDTNIIFVDVHAEASAEKQALSRYLDGRVCAVVGTHTHVQTADERILPGGTAYITDVGMSGPYDSCVGLRSDIAIKRFMLATPHKYELATEEVKISAVVVGVDTETGHATSIERILYPEFPTKRELIIEEQNA
jgi:2',3'-cyclic-nucleotide 2'-phosphodiesterase